MEVGWSVICESLSARFCLKDYEFPNAFDIFITLVLFLLSARKAMETSKISIWKKWSIWRIHAAIEKEHKSHFMNAKWPILIVSWLIIRKMVRVQHNTKQKLSRGMRKNTKKCHVTSLPTCALSNQTFRISRTKGKGKTWNLRRLWG